MKGMNKNNPGKIMAAILVTAVLSGCTTTPATIDTTAVDEMTADGLYPVRGSRADSAWARPDFDLSGFSKVMLHGADIQYRPGGETGRTFAARSRGGPYEVTQAQKDRLTEIVSDAFRDEMARSDVYEVVSEPGPDVLLVFGTLVDVVSYVPPDIPGRSDIYLSSVGDATLIVELRDSITNTVLARFADRRAAERANDMLFVSNRVTNSAEVRRLAQRWARALREGLEQYMATPGG